jgi:hypothetical protein
MAERGKAVPVNRWWLRLARERVQGEQGELGELGDELAKLAGRKKAWTHTSLSRFKNGHEPVTLELATALCKKYRLPPPVFFPRSFNEAVEMLEAVDKYDAIILDTDEDAKPKDPEAKVIPMPRKPRERKQPPVTVGEWTTKHGVGSAKKSG